MAEPEAMEAALKERSHGPLPDGSYMMSNHAGLDPTQPVLKPSAWRPKEGGGVSGMHNTGQHSLNDQAPTSNAKAHSMKELSLQAYAATKEKVIMARPLPNPIWLNFPTRCQREVKSDEHMKDLLRYHSNSSEILVVRYWQDGCVACNAVDKIVEFVCHDAKKNYPDANFYSVKREDHPNLTQGLIKYPQVKQFALGHWADLSFKPPKEVRESTYKKVTSEVRKMSEKEGKVLTALQAEEMYFSAAGPAMATIFQESFTGSYIKTKVRQHNYWKQISTRRTWFFRKYIEPQAPKDNAARMQQFSVLGEAVGDMANAAAKPAAQA